MAMNFYGIGNLSNLYGDYASIKNGSYKKLLNAYYSKVEGSREATIKAFSGKVSKENSNNIVEKDTLKSVKVSADSLGISAANLVEKGSDSVFKKEKVESINKETGDKTVSLEYNKEKIKEAVSKFVSDYNDVVEKSADTDSTNVMSKTLSMINNTNIYKDSLEKIGISIGSDNKLSIDEEKFDSANMTSVKSLFNDASSFGQRTIKSAMQISSVANYDYLSTRLYNNKGNYSNNDYLSLLNMYL